MLQRKTLALLVCIALIFNLLLIPQKTRAFVGFDPANFSANLGSFITEVSGTIGIYQGNVQAAYEWIDKNVGATLISAAKIAALYSVQALTRALIGDGGDGDAGIITDWRAYLTISPQQMANARMNSFFNTVSKGRLSSLNYEGIGPNYDAYLASEAKKSYSGQKFSTDIQGIVTNPREEMFNRGNMLGLMTYMQCANNVACFTLASQERYAKELDIETRVAMATQTNGFLPKKKNGKIVQPSAIIFNSLSQVDQMGTDLIMSTDLNSQSSAALRQIASGLAISVSARTLNYATSDENQQAALRAANERSPISSISYSATGGINMSAGGSVYNTGIGASTNRPASCTDGIKNQNETGIDCGGTCAKACR